MKKIFIYASVLILSTPCFVFAWTAPPGIVAPTWPTDLDMARPTLPSPWSSNTAGFYYIKNGGTNSGNGYPGNPKDSLDGSSLSPGDVVVIEVGTDYPDTEGISSNGTSGSPIWIMSSSDGTKVKCTGDWGFTGTYIILDDLNFDSGSRESSIAFTGDYIMARNTGITYTHDTSNGSGMSASSGASYVTWYQCDFGPLGNWQYTGASDIDQHGIKMNQSADHIWVLDSTFHELQGDAIQVGDDGYDPSLVNNIWIVGNTAYNCNQTGFWAKRSNDVIIAYNTVYGMGYYTSGGGGGACIGGQYPGTRYWALFNTCYDSARGIDLHEKTTGYAIGNVFYDIWGEASCNQWNYGGIHFRVTGTYYALHNTVYSSINLGTPSGSGTKYFAYNIFSSPDATSCYAIDTDQSPNVAHFDYDLYDSDAVRVDWAEGDGDTYTSLAAFIAGEGEEVNSYTGDPQFTDPGNGDFTIGATSAAIDRTGSSYESIYDLYYSTYGQSIKYDIAGTARPATFTDWDLGAYEYGSEVPSPPQSLNFTIKNVLIVN